MDQRHEEHAGGTESFDVAIVGGGPAGLSAALVLGRCCRRVLVCDSGEARNARSHGVNGYLTRDGVPPAELRRLGRAEVARYSVELRDLPAVDARVEAGRFHLRLADGAEIRARKLLIATGLIDELPPIPGLRELWGQTAFSCPHCDGWELRGRRLAVLGQGDDALALCRALTTWTRDIVLLASGSPNLAPGHERALHTLGVNIVTARVRAFEPAGNGAHPRAHVHLDAGPPLTVDGVFVCNPQRQRSPLLERLGATSQNAGPLETGWHGATDIPGLYVAGDASHDLQFAIIAAAEGAQAAVTINRELVKETFEQALTHPTPPDDRAIGSAAPPPHPPP